MRPLQMPELTQEQQGELAHLYRSTKEVRLRTRAQIVLLACEQHLTAKAIADIVREDDETVRRWLKRYRTQGIDGLRDLPMPGAPLKITKAYTERLLEVVRQRPAVWGNRTPCGRCNDWLITWQSKQGFGCQMKPFVVCSPLTRLSSVGLSTRLAVLTRSISKKKKTIEDTCDGLKPGEVFYYADEFNLSWLPTLRAMWSSVGQQVMVPTPGQQHTYYGIGAINYFTGKTVVQFQRHKRRQEMAQLLEALVEKHPTGTIYVVWNNANTHEDDEVDAIVQTASGRLVLLYLPTYSPWLNPIEMLWRHFRREVTHCELFETMQCKCDRLMA